MAQLIEIDNWNNVGSLIFNTPNEGVQEIINANFSHYVNTVGSRNSIFFDDVVKTHERYLSNQRNDISDLMRKKLSKTFETNIIRPLRTLSDIQSAPNIMRHLIMAHPEIRDKYSKGMISGYEGNFEDLFKDQVSGEKHYTYRRIVDGVLLEKNEKISSTQYVELTNPKDIISTTNKSIIRSVWNTLDNLKDQLDEDPTSEWGELL